MFCDYFLLLFYVGCYELRMDLLRTNLVTLFMVDEVRRIMSEAVVPYVMQWRNKKAKMASKERN
jgi:hypothetical protein